MISIIFGISLLAHLTIILAAKTKKLWDNVSGKKNTPKLHDSVADKAFTSLAIATFLEFTAFMIIISALNVLAIGFESDKSNWKVIKQSFYEFETKSVGFECLFDKECGSNPPDANIPLG